MARKPTKGPWEFHLGIDYAVVMGKDQTTEDALARLYGTSEEVEANGKLIAAAPDLLAALRYCLREHGGFTIAGECQRQALAAITKATGLPASAEIVHDGVAASI